jgi:hypothetical protein
MHTCFRAAISFCFMGLSSCAQWLGDMPNVDDQVIVAKVNTCNTGDDSPKVASDHMQVGFAKVYAACEEFFVSATKFQHNALATNQTLDAGLVGATSIVNATSAAATAVKAVSTTTAGIVLGKAVISDFSTVYSFGTHLYKVRQLVKNDMDAYASSAASPADSCVAYANVQKMAIKCTIANMQGLLDQQVAIPSQTVPSNAPVLAGERNRRHGRFRRPVNPHRRPSARQSYRRIRRSLRWLHTARHCARSPCGMSAKRARLSHAGDLAVLLR